MSVTLGLPLPLPPFFDFVRSPRGGLIGKGLELLTRQQVIEYWLNVLRITPGQYWPQLTPQIPKPVLGAIGLLLLLPDGLADGTYGPGMGPVFVLEPGIEPANLLPGMQWTVTPDPENPDIEYAFFFVTQGHEYVAPEKYCDTGDNAHDAYDYPWPPKEQGSLGFKGHKAKYRQGPSDGTFKKVCGPEGGYLGEPRQIWSVTVYDSAGVRQWQLDQSVRDTIGDHLYSVGLNKLDISVSDIQAQQLNPNGLPVGPRIPLPLTAPDPGYGPRTPAPGTRVVPMQPVAAAASTPLAPVPVRVRPATGSEPGTSPLPITQPEPEPIPLPGEFPLPQPAPGDVPVPLPTVPLPGVAPVPVPANPIKTTPGGAPIPLPAAPAPITPVDNHYPIPGEAPVTPGGAKPSLSAVAAEVGRVEGKVSKMMGDINKMSPFDWIDAINDLQELIEGLLPPPYIEPDTWFLKGVCEDLNDEGQQPVFSRPVPGGDFTTATIGRLDAIQDLLQAHLGYKTPTCNASTKPVLEGDWVTVRFESDQNSPNGERPLRKLLRYRTKSGADLDVIRDHWSDFVWTAGSVIVSHKGAWWGTPQVWARSIDEGKRVLHHAAREAGLDPDQVGQWVISGSRNPRYGMSGTMRVAQVAGLDWVTARDGPSALPDFAADP